MHYELAPDYRISRVIKGGWQLAGGHGSIDRDTSVTDMIAFCDAGITTFDCADIYTGVEELIGDFRNTYKNERGTDALNAIHVHTKCVPDLHKLSTITKSDIEASIDESLRRLQTERLDLVQFHWWDYEIDRYLDVAGWLNEMRDAGKIANLGGTNFDTQHLLALVEGGIPLVSVQVQYSVLDDRPGRAMVPAVAEHGVQLICYGTVSGGLLSEYWLGQPEPEEPLENRSLSKYKLIVDEFGGWKLFQELLGVMSDVAKRHQTDIASIASRVVLDRPGVAAVIVGARNRSHLASNVAILSLELTESDHSDINRVLAKSNPVPGDVYEIERDRNGRHGRIMKYNLNKDSA